MATLTIQNLFANNFNEFNSLSATRKNNQIQKINHIDRIARSLEIDINTVDLKKIFPTNDDGSISASPREIQRILGNFDLTTYNEELAIELDNFELTSRQIGAINRAASTMRNNANSQVTQEREQLLRQIRNNRQDIERYSTRALEIRRQIENTQFTFGSEYIEHIKRIVQTGNWTLDTIGGREITFITRNDIINTFTNPRAEINLRVNLGKFKLKIAYESLNTNLQPFENNINTNGYTHPHFSAGGEACLGNMSEIFDDASSTGDLFTIIDTLHKLLVNYNDANPFISLARFAVESRQIQPNGECLTPDNINN